MAPMRLAIFVSVVFGIGAVSIKDKENPIRKIVTTLENMQKELEHEADNEKELFDKAMCVCETGEKELQGVIDFSNGEITRLTSKIESETAEKQKLDKDLEAHAKDKVDTEESLAEATALREKEAAKFQENEKVTMFSEDQLARAIPMFDKKLGAAAFMQGDFHKGMTLKKIVQVAHYLNPEKRQKIVSFLDSGVKGKGRTAEPSAAASEIIGMMKAMQDEMLSDLNDMRKTESDAQDSFVSMKENKLEHLGHLMKMLSDKQKRSGEIAVTLVEDKDSLDDANTELENASKYLAALQEQCEQRRKDRDARQKMRLDEIAAISEAVKILTDDDALETFKKAVPSAALVQQKQPTYDALLQRESALKTKAMALIQKKVQLHAPDNVAKNADRAAKVVDFMIDNMVETLHEDDVSDEHKKDWCANETVVIHQLEADKEALHAQLEKTIEGLDNKLTTLTEEIKTLTMEIEDLDKEVYEASELRKKEHAAFAGDYANMDAAKALIKKAADRLAKFYSPKASGAFLAIHQVAPKGPPPAVYARLAKDADFDSLLQTKNNKFAAKLKQSVKVDPIVLPDTPVKYEKKESGGVVNLMSEMMSDLESDMTSSFTEEKHAAKDYVKMMKESAEMRAGMVKALKEKKVVKADTEERKQQTVQQNDLTINEIKHLELYLAQLHTECDFLMRNFDNRHDARVEEEGGLKSAESIVTHEEVPDHAAVEKKYEEEHTDQDVDEHFPHEEMPIF
eukprot:gnl/MRDRNA2_/MRDRNA2_59170_c0_seq1.p1 gnl/MRDRNA2_/MRDRNA2_59170_c0~~gnl/MRDRNA2_/MRDRNA2_59170_c0_seq1.p1  ORF type:complete len:739 (+),score=261.77 gnl/MRDRNA2_/MRDRNA2_59170_c0_seq1:97-2313(+)